jgi:hypothetical protein
VEIERSLEGWGVSESGSAGHTQVEARRALTAVCEARVRAGFAPDEVGAN